MKSWPILGIGPTIPNVSSIYRVSDIIGTPLTQADRLVLRVPIHEVEQEFPLARVQLQGCYSASLSTYYLVLVSSTDCRNVPQYDEY